MKKEFVARRLDVKAFAQAGEALSGQDALTAYPRLAEEAQGDLHGLVVAWSVHGEARVQSGAADQIWLHLQVQATVPLTCQRCLTPVGESLSVDRWFRFVADEATAAALDDESEDDVLVLSREFDLTDLIEDELLMALPLVPRHDVCPVDVQLEVKDASFESASAARENPFAALAGLRTGKSR